MTKPEVHEYDKSHQLTDIVAIEEQFSILIGEGTRIVATVYFPSITSVPLSIRKDEEIAEMINVALEYLKTHSGTKILNRNISDWLLNGTTIPKRCFAMAHITAKATIETGDPSKELNNAMIYMFGHAYKSRTVNTINREALKNAILLGGHGLSKKALKIVEDAIWFSENTGDKNVTIIREYGAEYE
jgi:hypothetical protein